MTFISVYKKLGFLSDFKATPSVGGVIAKDALKLAPGIFSRFIGGFVISLIMGKYLQPEEMGLYTMFWIAQSYGNTLFTGWLQNGSLRYLPENSSYLKDYMNLAVKSICIPTFIVSIFAFSTAYVWSNSVQPVYVAWTIAIFTFSSFFTTFQCYFRGVFIQSEYSVSSFLLMFTKILLLIFFIHSVNDRIVACLMAMAISYFITCAYQKVIFYRHLRFSMESKGNNNRDLLSFAMKNFSYGMPLTISLFLVMLLQTCDRYIMSSMVTIGMIGMYAFWMTIGMQLGQGLYRILFMAINPRLFQLYGKNPSQAEHFSRILTGMYLILAGPIFTAIGCVLPPLLNYLNINQKFSTASHLLFWGLFMAFLLGLAQLSGKRREFKTETIVFIYASLAGVVVMTIGVFFLTPFLSIQGTAFGSLGGFVIYFIIVASTSKGWPAPRDFLISASVSIFFYVTYRLWASCYSHFIGSLWLFCSVIFYILFAQNIYLRILKLSK